MRKPNNLDAQLARPGYWVALLLALYAWNFATSFAAPKPLGCTVAGVCLILAVLIAEHLREAVERRVRKAMALAGYSLKDATITLYGKVERMPDFEKALKGERPLDLQKLEVLLGEDYARHYATLTLIELGPPTYVRHAMQVMPKEAL